MPRPTSVIPAKRRVRRKRRGVTSDAPSPPPPPPPPPPTEVLVVSVTAVSANQVDFEFSAEVTCDGSASGQPIVDMPFFGWEGANASEQVAANVVRFSFPDDQVVGGISWSIDSVPAGLDLHGATMPVPQSGVVG